MNVRGLHLRPSTHSSYPRAAPGASLPRYGYPAASSVNYGPSGARDNTGRSFSSYARKRLRPQANVCFFLGNKVINPKTQFQKQGDLEVVPQWIKRAFQLVLCDLMRIFLPCTVMAIQIHCNETT